jgi:hypothetical protein
MVPIPESPSFQFASLASQEDRISHANTTFSAPPNAKEDGQGKGA